MKKLVVLGAGESGTGAALLAQAKGYQVFVSDLNTIAPRYKEVLASHQIPFEEGQHTLELLQGCDEVVKSPGIPNDVPVVQALIQQGLPVVDEIEFAARYTSAFIIAITGSNGKTTTTQLIYHLLKAAGMDVGLAGNVGTSFAWQVLTQPHTHYVLELSSFQLEHVHQFKADIGVLLPITPDHLDRYDYNMEGYIRAKGNLLQNMTPQEHLFYCPEDPHSQKIVTTHTARPTVHPISLLRPVSQGVYSQHSQGDSLHITLGSRPVIIPSSVFPLPGPHNRLNAMMALGVAALLGIQEKILESALQSFEAPPHRLSWVGKVKGIDFYDDSKATNVEAAFAGLSSFTRPIIWLAGGYDKGNDYALLQPLVRERVKVIICIGKDNSKLREAFASIIPAFYEVENMDEAIEIALREGQEETVVLLSPACASFDRFRNYEHRGMVFREALQRVQNANPFS